MDSWTYSEYDRQVLCTIEKRMHNELKCRLQILRKDFASLDGQHWLTDTIIEAYFTSFVDKEKLYVLSSIQASAIAEKGSTLTAIRKQLASFDFIAGPVHINNNHWALLFVSIRTQTVLYIDSKGEGPETSKKVLRNWSTFSKSRNDMKQTKWIMTSYDHVLHLESDNSNCGVFACYFFEHLLKQDMAELNQPFDLNNYRTEIKKPLKKTQE